MSDARVRRPFEVVSRKCRVRRTGLASAWIAVAWLNASSACQFDHDTVGAGYYGVLGGTGAAGSTTSVGAGGVQGTGGVVAKPPATPTAGSSAAGSVAQTSTAGSAALSGAGSAALSSGGGSAATGSAGSGTAGASETPQAGASGAPRAPEQGGTGGSPTLPAGPCDMSGRWLGTLHYVTDALGNLQYTHTYLYYEIQQQGDALMITKGLHCGDDAIGGGLLSATIDFKKSWAGCASHVNYVGRTGTSVEAASGCQIDLAKWYVVRGASVPYYLDPATTLPSADQQAMGMTPGWEDWDGDGNPGVTGMISGAVTGKIFVAPRTWNQLTGSVANLDSVIKLTMIWDQDQNVMAYDGSPLLATGAVRAADATLHFAQFIRLTPDQAAGDDAAICQSITRLAPMLTPEAAGM